MICLQGLIITVLALLFTAACMKYTTSTQRAADQGSAFVLQGTGCQKRFYRCLEFHKDILLGIFIVDIL